MSLRLEDIELIRRLKCTYSRAIDTGDMATVKSLFTEDATVDYRGGSYHVQLSGRAAIVEALAGMFVSSFVGSHTVHMPVIDVHDDDTADGTWTLIDYALNLAEGNKTTVGTAIYRDRYVKRDGRWLIAQSEYDRVYERVYTDPAPGLTAHYLATQA
ncbi:uncharacterized protein (TIGR02246 family) [Sphingomonas zeicaulis]|uniref:nuclear transport factor 2 family protein n=1 Tax=Sphingomonas zeicaulis TaxID=1632740 RepID=UPI003D19101C